MTSSSLQVTPPDEADVDPPPASTPAPTEGVAIDASPPTGPPEAPDPSPALAAAAVLVGSLAAAAFFSTLAASLVRALPSSVGRATDDDDRRAELARHLERAEALGASAGLAAYAFRAAAVLALYALLSATLAPGPAVEAALTVAIGGPLLHLVTQSLPFALAQARGGALVAATLPAFAAVSRPFTPLVALLRGVRRAVLRAARTPDTDDGTRRLVEGFRAMVEGEDFDGDLGEETQELIANVIEFGEADAAEVMTPRTEIRAIDETAALTDAVRVFADAGFSRIPVYEETIDSIIGTLTAVEAAKAVAEGRLDSTRIRDVMRPPLIVPETVRVPQLLAQFRAERQKMAIVVDEYGGTAGLVTLADVIAEIVGHVKDEYEAEDLDFRPLEGGAVEASAGLHVSEVNEELDLAIPEESDYETLAGFVLSELGRFPAHDESFTAGGVTFRVTEASDRRVLRVAIDRPGGVRIASDREGATPAPPAAARRGASTAVAGERTGGQRR
ncbi:MAG: hemolysin family protein, partial [Planctomycetota bacterium]